MEGLDNFVRVGRLTKIFLGLPDSRVFPVAVQKLEKKFFHTISTFCGCCKKRNFVRSTVQYKLVVKCQKQWNPRKRTQRLNGRLHFI